MKVLNVFFYKLAVLLFCLLFSKNTLAQVEVSNLDSSKLPKSINYEGNLIKAVKWKDKMGINIVLLTETHKIKTPNSYDEDAKDAALFAYHFIARNDSIVKSWRVYDFVKNCSADIFLNFIKGAFSITDLNEDGYAEVWMMYKNSCRSDVSPISMKIIMYEKNKKFALRGSTTVKVNETDFEGGDYEFDKAFNKAPTSFKNYAKHLWEKNKLETWGN